MTVTVPSPGSIPFGGWLEVQALLVLVVAFISGRRALNWTGRAMRRARVDLGTQILVKRALLVIWLIVTLLVVLGILGVNPAGLLAVAGAVGLAFSLAIQDILKNFFAGVYLLLERPFRVGDTIQVKEQQGVVDNIGVRTTELRTPENVQVLVPNAVEIRTRLPSPTTSTHQPAYGTSRANVAPSHTPTSPSTLLPPT